MKRIAIFASGTGTNAEQIIRYFTNHPSITVALVVSNKPGAGVLQVAEQYHVPSMIIEKEDFFRGDSYLKKIQEYKIDFIVLAGFLWKIPNLLIAAYRNHIINIHPALLPKYGGKGMYGIRVHEAVIAAGDKQSGITIHFVDEQYDHGDVIFQETCALDEQETPLSLAEKIHRLEHAHFPKVIEKILSHSM